MPGLNFPFFVHMMNQMKAEAEALGGITVIESDGQNQTPKQTADVETAIVQGVDGIVISPREVDAMAPAMQQAVDAGIPVVTIDRRVDKVPGILAHVGADNVKGGEAQGELIMKLFPDGATIINLQGTPGASPAIDRTKGLHNVLDPHADKYKFVFEQTANFTRADGLSVTESALGGMDTPPDVIVAGNDDMIFGAIEALKARNITDVVTIGFDALPEALVPGPRRHADRDRRAVPRRPEPRRGAGAGRATSATAPSPSRWSCSRRSSSPRTTSTRPSASAR